MSTPMKPSASQGTTLALMLVVALALLALALLVGCGQAEKGVEGAGGPAVTNPTYDADIAPMFASYNCDNCHAGALASPTVCNTCHPAVDTFTRSPTDAFMKGLDYTTLLTPDGSASMVGTAHTIVVPNSPSTSTLYWVVTNDTTNFQFDGGPHGSPNGMLGFMNTGNSSMPLGAGDVQTILNWINSGAPQN